MEREIVKVIRVQPGLNVLIEDSHNILLEVAMPDGSTLARSGALTNIGAVIEALDFARTWVRIQEENPDE